MRRKTFTLALNGRAFMTRGVFFLATAIVIAIVSFVSVRPALAQRPQASEAFVEEIEIRGNRRIPRESVLYYVQSKPQDRFDLSLAQRDLQSVIQMGLFDPLSTKLFVEDGPRGGKIIIFHVKEYPIIRIKEIQFVGERDGFSQRRLRGAMKLVKEAGLFTNFTSKDIYFKDKLQ